MSDDKKLDMDKLLTWLLMAISTAAFGWLVSEVKAVGAKLDSINTRVTVIEAQRVSDRVDKLEERLRLVEGRK